MESYKSMTGFKGCQFKIKKKDFAMDSLDNGRDNVTIEIGPNGEQGLKQSICVQDISLATSYHNEEVGGRKSTYSRDVEDEHTYADGIRVEKVYSQYNEELTVQSSNHHVGGISDEIIDHTGESIVEQAIYDNKVKKENSFHGDHLEIEETYEGDVEIEQTHQVPTSEVVVDLTQEFDRIFRQKCFQSFSEFEVLFNQFKEETGSVFRVKSSCSVVYENSRRKKHVIPERYKFVSIKYCCVHYGQPKISGIGIRSKQRYLPCGCSCILTLAYSRGGLFISQVSMLHNHQVSSQMAPYYAINRHIKKKELQEIADVVEMMPSSRSLQQYLTEHFQRPITLQDAKNVRTRLKSLQSVTAVSKAVKSIYTQPSIKTEKPDIVTCIIDDQGDEDPEEIDTLEIQEETAQDEVDEMEEFYDVESTEIRTSAVAAQCKSQVLEETKTRFSEILNNCSEELFWERMTFMTKVFDCWENNESCTLGFEKNSQKDNTKISPVVRNCGEKILCTKSNNSQKTIQQQKYYKSKSLNSHKIKTFTSISKSQKSKRGPGRPRKYPLPQNEIKAKEISHFQPKDSSECILVNNVNKDRNTNDISTEMEVDEEIEETGIEIELEESGNIHNIKRIHSQSLQFEDGYVTADILHDKTSSNKIR